MLGKLPGSSDRDFLLFTLRAQFQKCHPEMGDADAFLEVVILLYASKLLKSTWKWFSKPALFHTFCVE